MSQRVKRVHFLKTLKSRLRLLLAVTIVIPVIFIGVVTGFKVYDLYKTNTDMMINNELNQIREDLEQAFEGMLYMSQQLVLDESGKTGIRLYAYFDESNPSKKIELLRRLSDQIAVYEIANPNIANITCFYKNESGKLNKINNSLALTKLPEERYCLASNANIAYYGPHTTLAKPSRYPVVSMVRKISVNGYEVYIYMESGYKKMSFFAANTLDSLDATYMVVSDNGGVVYSSNSLIDVNKVILKAGDKKISLNNTSYIPYKIKSKLGWSLVVLVPYRSYTVYMKELILKYAAITICTVLLGLALYFLIWNSVNRPFKQFERNLKQVMNNDPVSELETINVKEMDENFEHFSKMKSNILGLVRTVQEQEKQKSQLEIKQLLSKINPHFINNTLDTLKWYTQQRGYNDVVKFVSSLNKLLIYNMEKDKLTTLESELNAIEDYITLQSYKYDLDFSREVSLPSSMLKTEIPRFILQPLVENAILHGLEGKGRIAVNVSLLPNGKISIKVCNNGFLISDDVIERILHSDKDISNNGIGIQYVMRMLEHKFAAEYSFNITRNDKDETQMEIVVPFCKGDMYVKNTDC